MNWELITRLMNCFPNSIINQNGEFIAHIKSNTYFILRDCKTELDVKCKILEWFSRPAHKTITYSQGWRDRKFHEFMLNGINDFLDTNFTAEDMELIYTYLGNACDHEKTVQFVESGYDVSILAESEE